MVPNRIQNNTNSKDQEKRRNSSSVIIRRRYESTTTWILVITIVVASILLVGVEAGVRKFKNNTNSTLNESKRSHTLTSRKQHSALNNNQSSSTPFALKSEKYRKNFVKLVENFLLKHIEKALKKKANSEQTTTTTNDSSDKDEDLLFADYADEDLFRIMSRCNQTSCKHLNGNSTSGKIAELSWNLAKISNRFKKRLNQAKKANRTQELLDDTKGYFLQSKSIEIVIIITLLETISQLLLPF